MTQQMRLLTFMAIVLLGLGCAGTKNGPAKSSKLNGIWIPVKQEMGGTTIPPAAFEKQKLVINDTTYTVIAESIDKGSVKCKGNKMDIYGRGGVNAGKHFTAIYKLEEGQLVICYNLKGDSYPDAFGTNGKPLYFLSVFKREATK